MDRARKRKTQPCPEILTPSTPRKMTAFIRSAPTRGQSVRPREETRGHGAEVTPASRGLYPSVFRQTLLSDRLPRDSGMPLLGAFVPPSCGRPTPVWPLMPPLPSSHLDPSPGPTFAGRCQELKIFSRKRQEVNIILPSGKVRRTSFWLLWQL